MGGETAHRRSSCVFRWVDTAHGCVPSAMARPGFAADPRATSTSCCMSARMMYSSGTVTICFVKSLSALFKRARRGSGCADPPSKSNLRIPAGTQSGTTFRIKGKGIRNVQGYGQGDLHVRVCIEVPTQLTSAQKAKLQEFAGLCNGKESPISQGFSRRQNISFTEFSPSHHFLIAHAPLLFAAGDLRRANACSLTGREAHHGAPCAPDPQRTMRASVLNGAGNGIPLRGPGL